MRAWLSIGVGLAVWAASVPAPAWAQPGGKVLPAKFQSVLFKKILAYNRLFKDKTIKVAVVDEQGADVDGILGAFKSAGIQAEKVQPNNVGNAQVVYLFSANPELKKACESRKVLTISGSPALARNKSASVSVTMRDDGKPGIIINQPSYKAEGQDFEATLLSLADVVK